MLVAIFFQTSPHMALSLMTSEISRSHVIIPSEAGATRTGMITVEFLSLRRSEWIPPDSDPRSLSLRFSQIVIRFESLCVCAALNWERKGELLRARPRSREAAWCRRERPTSDAVAGEF